MEQPTLNPESGLLRFRIDFSYDGSAFSGWAKQPDQRTIQGEMECMVLMMGIYLTISLLISSLMNIYNNSVKLKER